MFQQYLYHHHFSIPPVALLFPAVNPRRRYLIHNTVQENFPQLTTLSVGQGEQRRTAVTFKKNSDDAATVASGDPKSSDNKSQCASNKQGGKQVDSSVRQESSSQSKYSSTSQPQSQSKGHDIGKSNVTQEQQTNSKKEDQVSDRPARRPEQLLYSPQRQGSQQRIDIRRDTLNQQTQQPNSKHLPPQQSEHNTPARSQQQQQRFGKPRENVDPQHQQGARQSTPATQNYQEQVQPQKKPSDSPSEGNSKFNQGRYTRRESGNHYQPPHQRPRNNRSRSCNSDTRSSSAQSNLGTFSDRLGHEDESMRDDCPGDTHQQGRKKRNRRSKKQKDKTPVEDREGKTEQQLDKLIEKGKNGDYSNQHTVNSRKSESVQSLNSVSANDACHERLGSSGTPINNEFNRVNSDSFQGTFMKSYEETDSWRDSPRNNRNQSDNRSPISSRKEEFRESESSSPSDSSFAKHSPERIMPVTVSSDQGNNRRRGKAPAQIYRPPPARSTRDVPPQQPPQQHPQPHQPIYSQPYQPKQNSPQSYHPYQNQQQHYSNHPSHPHNNYFQQQHNNYHQQQQQQQYNNYHQQQYNNYHQQQQQQQQQYNNYHQQKNQDYQHYHSLPTRQRTDSESSNVTTSGDKGKGRRPDQVLYVPRGRRSTPADPSSARGTPTPLLDYENNGRAPSPTYSICSTASEYSGRNRYSRQGGSRQGSQISIYEGENDRIQSKPPLSREISRESTPVTGKPKGNGGRFNSQTLQLIERCLNQDSDPKYSEYSNGGTDTIHNSPSTKNNKVGGGRSQKSPTPTRDFHSIHSKENMIHPVDPNSRSRRSRKNRRRQSRSRESSADQYNNGQGKNDSYNSPGERGLGSCERIFYNSSYNTSHDRYDRGYDNYDRYSSINSSRASSRNSSRERTPQYSPQHSWRAGSNPSSPTKSPGSFYQNRQSPGKPPSGRLGSLPNVALDFGDSPKRVSSNHNDENQGYNTMPNKTRTPIRCNSLRNPGKNNIEYSSGCIVSDRIESNERRETPLNNTQVNDLIPQNQESLTSGSHNEELTKNLINTSCNSSHNGQVSEESSLLKDIKECEENRFADKIESESTHSADFKDHLSSELMDSSKIDEDSSAKDLSVIEPMMKSVEISSEMASEEEGSYDMEADKSRNESIKDSTDELTSSDNDTKDNQVLDETVDKEKSNPKKFEFNWADEEEDSWDNLYDDNGECLNKEIKRQLSDSLGKIKLEKPANDYYSFQPKDQEINEEEYGHVIEIYDFPPSFTTQDLMMVFTSFQNTGFDIRWVDDTHALGIFATQLIAAEALSVPHPFLKTRSLSQATKTSKSKAMRITEALLPYKPRPQTSASLARRLVSGALGLKVNISREVREAEKQKLKDAKAQKRLAAKQRADAWEGNLG